MFFPLIDLNKDFHNRCFGFCFCLPRQESDKCFECNSQRPYDPYHHRNSHRIENVIYLMDKNDDKTWWQSVNGRCWSVWQEVMTGCLGAVAIGSNMSNVVL